MGRYGSLDYPRLAKRSFLFGLSLFVLGLLGQVVLGTTAGTPAWELTLLLDLEAIGLVVAFLSPFVFGIFLPLTE
jgi:hypothetical protein